MRPTPRSTLFPYTTLFRSETSANEVQARRVDIRVIQRIGVVQTGRIQVTGVADGGFELRRLIVLRSEEHTSELQSRRDLVCRLLLEKKKNGPTQPQGRRWH